MLSVVRPGEGTVRHLAWERCKILSIRRLDHAKKILLIANNGPEDPNRATVPLLTAKALVESGNKVFIWLYNNAVYLMQDGTPEFVQAPGLPPFEDLLLFLKDKVSIGVSCAVVRGLCNEKHEPQIKFSAGELAAPPKLASLIEECDNTISF
jgi:predicted peroxiredoxin